jgi:hypothetical protein
VLEYYLRVYYNYKQDNWPKLLPIAIFVYNNSIYVITRRTPQDLLIGYIADLENTPKGRSLEGEAPLAIK